MAAANRAFDETLYRLVEQENPASGASEIKARMDRDPKFRAEFEQTRKTVVHLQGLAPAPSPLSESGFSQRDFDRLTRDILKGYKTKFADIFFELGSSYFLDVPSGNIGTCFLVPPADASLSADRLRNALSAYGSMAPSSDALLSDLRAKAESSVFLDVQPRSLLDRSLDCLGTSRLLRPKNSLTWSREAVARIRKGELEVAESMADTAFDLAKSRYERSTAVNTKVVKLKFQDRDREVFRLLGEYLPQDPSSEPVQYNFAVSRMVLGDLAGALDGFSRLFSLVPTSDRMRSVIQGGIESASSWKTLKQDPSAYGRFVRLAETYLEEKYVKMIEAVK